MPTEISGSTGVNKIQDGTVVNADINSSAAIDTSKLAGDNTPSFKVLATDGTSISHNTWTKITFGTEVWDTDNAFASDKFTVPSGKDGKYQFNWRVKLSGIDDNEYIRTNLYRNGSKVEASGNEWHSPVTDAQVPNLGSYTMSLSAGDYVELYCYHVEGSTRTMFGGTDEYSSDASYLQAIRLIGV
jgi:spore coat protein U-like protein